MQSRALELEGRSRLTIKAYVVDSRVIGGGLWVVGYRVWVPGCGFWGVGYRSGLIFGDRLGGLLGVVCQVVKEQGGGGLAGIRGDRGAR